MREAMYDDITLNRQQIQSRAFGESFNRGEILYENGAISSPVRRGDEINARCRGSYPQPYRVWAKFVSGGIAAASCSCEYDRAGDCKHIVAMLLTHLHQPERFEEREALHDELMSREKRDLVDIIEQMIVRYPDLEDIVERATVNGSPNEIIDLQAIRHELKQSLTFSGEWMNRAAEIKVYELTSLGDRYAWRGNYAHAIAIYCAILEECNANDYPTDDEGQYIEAINNTVALLKEALLHLDFAQHEELRQRVLDVLVGALIWDIEFGGIGYGDEADDIILEIAQPADTPRIRERIRLAEERNLRSHSYSEWGSEAYEYFLMELDRIDSTDPEEALKRLQSKELHYLYAGVLLDLKRYEQAACVIRTKLQSSHELRRGLDLLVDHQQLQTAIQLAEGALESDYDTRIADWLIDLYRKQGDEEAEFRCQLKRMRRDPQIDHYISLGAAAEAVGAWQDTRPQIISELQQKKAREILTLVHLHDEEWDSAWKTFGETPIPDYRFPFRPIHSLAFTVAKRSRRARPALAIPVYIQCARVEIAGKNRKYYAVAAELLGEVREMYQQMNDSASWQTLIADLREEFQRRPALQDELKKAGL